MASITGPDLSHRAAIAFQVPAIDSISLAERDKLRIAVARAVTVDDLPLGLRKQLLELEEANYKAGWPRPKVLEPPPVKEGSWLGGIINLVEAGTWNSGHRGHRGIPGYRGGSLPATGGALGWGLPSDATMTKHPEWIPGIVKAFEMDITAKGLTHGAFPQQVVVDLLKTTGDVNSFKTAMTAALEAADMIKGLDRYNGWIANNNTGIANANNNIAQATAANDAAGLAQAQSDLAHFQRRLSRAQVALATATNDIQLKADDIASIGTASVAVRTGVMPPVQVPLQAPPPVQAPVQAPVPPPVQAPPPPVQAPAPPPVQAPPVQAPAPPPVQAPVVPAPKRRGRPPKSAVAAQAAAQTAAQTAAPAATTNAPPREPTPFENLVYTGKIPIKDLRNPQILKEILNQCEKANPYNLSYAIRGMIPKVNQGYVPTDSEIKAIKGEISGAPFRKTLRNNYMNAQSIDSAAEFARRQAAGQKLTAPEYNTAKNTASKLPPKSISDIQGANSSWQTRNSQDPNGKGDPLLFAIYQHQGFNGKAKVVPPHIFDDMVKAEGARVLFRGLHSEVRSSQFRERDHFGGFGVYGNGTYTSPDWGTAVSYATDQGKGSGLNMRVALRPGARITTYAAMQNEVRRFNGVKHGTRTEDDEGRLAAWLGYDAVEIGSPNHVLVLNRSALIVDQTDYAIAKAEF